jgi:cyanophycin synthetase
MLRTQLQAGGVDDERIAVIPSEVDAVEAALKMAQEGDLIVIFGDNIKRCWKQVAGYQAGEAGEEAPPEEPPTQGFVQADPNAFRLEPGAELIRDERGVRIARVDEESD